MSQVVLVTGVSQEFGARLARLLASDTAVSRVVGVDMVPPRFDLGAVRFVRADIRQPVIAKVLAAEEVDTVVHASVIAAPGRAGGRSTMKELNVIGTMQLLAACQKAPGVRRLVLKSSTAVYGSSARDPAMFTEDMAPKRLPRSGFAKDATEVEGYVRGLSRRRPDMAVTVLRQAAIIGPRIDSTMARYLSMPVIPTPMGFDARMQFCHESDALRSLQQAVRFEGSGIFNIAGDGAMVMSQVIRRTGRPPMPVPSFAASAVGRAFRSARLADFSPEQVEYLTYGRCVDTTAMRDRLGFEPEFSTERTLDDFLRSTGCGVLAPDRLRGAERRLQGLLSRGSADG